MDDDKKKQINNAIELMKSICNDCSCGIGCPLWHICAECTCAKNAQVVDSNTQKMRVDSGCCKKCNNYGR